VSGSTAAAIDLTTPPREADASSWSTQPITVRARTSPTRLAKRAWRSSVTNPCGTPAEAMVPLTKGGSAGHAVSSLALLGAGLIGLGLIRRRCA
jgi:hypothetical protein